MIVDIKDAPFTEEEKEIILAMGIIKADWGYPAVTLDDPVKYFKDKQARFDNFPKAQGDNLKPSRWEKGEDPQPFENGS